MKYIVGASIGGLFGISVPIMMDVDKVDNKVPRLEDSQPVEDITPVPINGALILPDNICGYIDYESDDPKEQAKECLDVDILAVPAI
jgi:hypothetical protein